MATMQSILDRTRLELGDQPKTFRQEWYGDGYTNRWELDYSPVDAPTVIVVVDGTDVSDEVEVEESSGVLVFDTAPGADELVVVTGTYYRYFTSAELNTLITSAVQEHLLNRTNAWGQALTLENMPPVEDGVVALAATIKALFVLATDASFDIDILTPDGVSIPRSERYRQLMQMAETRKEQHKQICEALNIGPGRIEVFTLRRISRWTNHLVPVYKPQEIDDYTPRERVRLPIPTYGAEPQESDVPVTNINFVKGDTYFQAYDYSIDLTGYTITAQVRPYPQAAAKTDFLVTVTDAAQGLVSLSLTAAQTTNILNGSYWDMQIESGGVVTTVMRGRVFVTSEVTR